MGGKAALILVIGFSILMSYTLLNMNSAGTRSINNMSRYNSMTSSHNLAVAGANAALASLYQDTTRFPSHNKTYSGAMFNGRLDVRTISTGPSQKRVTSIASSSYAPGRTNDDTVIVDVAIPPFTPFTQFAWLTNVEDGVYWVTGDTVWGQVRSNDNLWVDGSPVFMQRVTTSRGFIPPLGRTQGGHTNHAVFVNPPVPTTGAPKVTLPPDLSALNAKAHETGATPGKYYNSDISVKLDPGDGTAGHGMAIVSYTVSGTPHKDTVMLNSATFNGVIGSGGRISVEGTLNGKLSLAAVGSGGDVYITNDIIYHTPRTDPSCSDLLGLAANDDVIMADNAANRANRDHYIDANIFALGSWTAENYASGGERGNLRVWGSIVQNTRGAIGTFGGGTRTGYLKRYTYDVRLANGGLFPPGYPGFNQATYAVRNWWESGSIMRFDDFYAY